MSISISSLRKKDLESHNLPIALSFARYLQREGIWKPSGTGRTSYGETYPLYSVDELASVVSSPNFPMLEQLRRFEASKRRVRTPEKPTRVIGKYTLFGGPEHARQPTGHVEFTGTKTGNWIITDEGKRKRANSRHLVWHPYPAT